MHGRDTSKNRKIPRADSLVKTFRTGGVASTAQCIAPYGTRDVGGVLEKRLASTAEIKNANGEPKLSVGVE